MSYYMQKGDFYGTGTGYYRGDPGFFGNLFGDIKKGFGQVVSAAAPILGSFAGIPGIGGLASPVQAAPPMLTGAARATNPGYQNVGLASRVVSGGRRVLSAASSAFPGIGQGMIVGPTATTTAVAAVGGVPRGYHIIKRGPHAGLATKNRHMNVTNPRALRRSIRRAHGFSKLAMKVIGFSRPHGKPKGHAYFKAKRRK